jgi:hypothetical protein
VQVTVGGVAPSFKQTQPAPLATLSSVMPEGSVSVTVTEVELLGPELLTESVYVTMPPVATRVGEAVIASDRSPLAV